MNLEQLIYIKLQKKELIYGERVQPNRTHGQAATRPCEPSTARTMHDASPSIAPQQ